MACVDFAWRLHSERNASRCLPCSPLASACFEHSIESGVRGAVVALALDAPALAAAQTRTRARTARETPGKRAKFVVVFMVFFFHVEMHVAGVASALGNNALAVDRQPRHAS